MVVARFDGMKESVSSKGTAFGDVFYKEVDANGEEAMEQSKYRTFNSDVLAVCRMLKKGELISIDLEIKDAVVRGVSRVDMED